MVISSGTARACQKSVLVIRSSSLAEIRTNSESLAMLRHDAPVIGEF